MKLKLLASLILISVSWLLNGCIFIDTGIHGNENVVKQKRQVSSFKEINVSNGIEVHIIQGPEKQVVVEADENLQEIIEVRTEGGRLKISTSKSIRKAKSKKIFVTAPKINTIKSFAGSRVFADNKLRAKNLEISSNAGSVVNLKIETAELKAKASAGSHIKLDGSTTIFVARANSGSNIKAAELNTSDSSLKVSSGANIWINSNNKIVAQASSGGNIFYFGSPKVVETSKSSGGNIIKR